MIKQHPLQSGFGHHSTADDVLDGIDLSRRTAVVTGGYSGLGLEITRSLTGADATVIVPARRPETAAEAIGDMTGVEVVPMDLADVASVQATAATLVERGTPIDMVINNAGIMAVPERHVGSGWESQFAINHLGHFALVDALLPVLSTSGCRVVSVSSAGHFNSGIRWNDHSFDEGYDRWAAYGQSKTANALFAVHLNNLGTERGIQAFSLHPGSILTPLQRHFPHEEKVELGWIDENGTVAAGFKSPAQGAATAAWAATSPLLNDRGGEYLQDCDIAEIVDHDDMSIGGVKPWAIDPEQAERLWELSAKAVTGS